MYQIVIWAAAVLFGALGLLLSRKMPKALDVALKALVVFFYVVGFFRLMLSDAFPVTVINGGMYGGVKVENVDYLQTVLRWGYALNYAVLPAAVFLSSRLLRNIASYVCLPFTVLSVIFFDGYMPYFLSDKGLGLHLPEWFRYSYFALELALALIIPILLQISNKHIFRVKDVREWGDFLIALPFALLTVMPVYVPQSLSGYKYDNPGSGSTVHLVWMALLVGIIIALYYIFRFKSYEQRYSLMVFLALASLINTNSVFLMGFALNRLPLQLCSIASYFFLFTIIFKVEWMFKFCYLANTVGALIAIIMPSLSDYTLSFWGIHYFTEHIFALVIPTMCMGLRIFPRLTSKAFVPLTAIFTVYYSVILTIGTLINGSVQTDKPIVNYFYVFDLEFAFDYFPFFTFAGDYVWQFGNYVIYPIIVFTVFFAYLLLCAVFYWITAKLQSLEDDRFQLRLSSIDLYEKITGKVSKRPRAYKD